MYTCALCTKTFQNSTRLDYHLVTHTKEKPHKCLKCSAAFGQASSLKKHIKSVHDGIKRNRKRNSQCPLCSYKGYTKTYLARHLRKHSTELPFSCKVPSCGFKTKYNASLSQHVRAVHTGERPFECPSDGCGHKAKTKEHLRNHLRVHSNEKPFACRTEGCNYSCKDRSSLRNHTLRVHSDEKPFKCSTCNFRGKTGSDLRRHQLTHTKVKRFKCEALNCSFASYEQYKVGRHFDAKHRKKDVRCVEPGCNFTCGSTTLLKVHMKEHERPILKCPNDSCSYSTKSKRSLAQHISRSHKDRLSATMVGPRISNVETAGTADVMETLNCTFPECGFQTKFPHLYDRHKVTHEKKEKRKHVCAYCFARFRELSSLRSHIQRHVGEKPYSCSYCKYTSVDSSDLRKHARGAHHIHVMPCGKDDEVTKCRICNRNIWSHIQFVIHSMNHLQPVVVLERLLVNIR